MLWQRYIRFLLNPPRHYMFSGFNDGRQFVFGEDVWRKPIRIHVTLEETTKVSRNQQARIHHLVSNQYLPYSETRTLPLSHYWATTSRIYLCFSLIFLWIILSFNVFCHSHFLEKKTECAKCQNKFLETAIFDENCMIQWLLWGCSHMDYSVSIDKIFGIVREVTNVTLVGLVSA